MEQRLCRNLLVRNIGTGIVYRQSIHATRLKIRNANGIFSFAQSDKPCYRFFLVQPIIIDNAVIAYIQPAAIVGCSGKGVHAIARNINVSREEQRKCVEVVRFSWFQGELFRDAGSDGVQRAEIGKPLQCFGIVFIGQAGQEVLRRVRRFDNPIGARFDERINFFLIRGEFAATLANAG